MPTYCTAQDVKDFLQLAGWNGILSDTIVNNFIEYNEEFIDKSTGTAWRERRAVNEYNTIPRRAINWEVGAPINLLYSPVRQFNSSLGDKIEVWNGSTWDDWLVTRQEGRDKDFWVDYEDGILFLRYWLPVFYSKFSVRVTYRYGYTSVAPDIKKATILLTAADILENESRSTLTPAGELQFMGYSDRVDRWRREAREIIMLNTKFRVAGFD
jgi:hypothetical protein